MSKPTKTATQQFLWVLLSFSHTPDDILDFGGL